MADISDDFTGTGALSANWGTFVILGGFVRTSDQAAIPASTHSANFWSGNSFEANHYAVIDCETNDYRGALVNGTTNGTDTDNGYIVTVSGGDATIYRIDSGSFTQIGSSATLASTPGTGGRWKGAQESGDIVGYYGAVEEIRRSDSALSYGAPGIYGYYEGIYLDNFVGGPIVVASGSPVRSYYDFLLRGASR